MLQPTLMFAFKPIREPLEASSCHALIKWRISCFHFYDVAGLALLRCAIRLFSTTIFCLRSRMILEPNEIYSLTVIIVPVWNNHLFPRNMVDQLFNACMNKLAARWVPKCEVNFVKICCQRRLASTEFTPWIPSDIKDMILCEQGQT